MCVGVGAEIGFRWPAVNPYKSRLASAVRTTRILQFPLEPSQALLGEGTGISVASPFQQLEQCTGEQFGSTTIGISFQSVPVPVRQA